MGHSECTPSTHTIPSHIPPVVPNVHTCGTRIVCASWSPSRAVPQSDTQADTPLVSQAPTPTPENNEDRHMPSAPLHRSEPSTACTVRPPMSGGGGGVDGGGFGVVATEAPRAL